MLMEGELLGLDLVAPRPQVLLELSGVRESCLASDWGGHISCTERECCGQLLFPQGPSKRGCKTTFLCDPPTSQSTTGWTSSLASAPFLHSTTAHLHRVQRAKGFAHPAFSQPSCFLESQTNGKNSVLRRGIYPERAGSSP